MTTTASSTTLLRKLLVGIDASDGAGSALRWAARLAADTGATVIAIHVLTYNHELARDLTLDTMRTWRLDLRRELETIWVQPLRDLDIEHRCLVVEADTVAGGLLDAAGRADADLLVIGSGRSGVADRLLGSTYRLTHDAHLPAIVVPPAWHSPVPAAVGGPSPMMRRRGRRSRT